MFMINPELLSLAAAKLEKSANMPPMDPAAQAMGAVPPTMPGDPSAQAMAALDPAMAAPAPPPAPPAPAAAPQGQKLKPEQMMQMLDYRLYNMQQQLTAIMNAMGVQVAPESLVLPPGTTGAPPAETALPGGPMAPPPAADPAADPAAAQAAPPPADPGMDPAAAGAMPPADPAKMANWWDRASAINAHPAAGTSLLHKAHAAEVLRRSRRTHAD